MRVVKHHCFFQNTFLRQKQEKKCHEQVCGDSRGPRLESALQAASLRLAEQGAKVKAQASGEGLVSAQKRLSF